MKPHLTEKSYLLATAVQPAFTFMVSAKTTSAEVTAYIKEMYGKDVIEVRFVSNAKKQVKRKGIKGTVSARRKAIVVLKPGQTIAAFDIPSEHAHEDTKEAKEKKTVKESKKS